MGWVFSRIIVKNSILTPTLFLGLLPIVQWLINLERNPPMTRSLLNIERLQGWSMLFYYPLEHIYYLTSHSLIPTSINFKLPFSKTLTHQKQSTLTIAPDTVSLYSSRFWAAYVFLQLLHLHEDKVLLQQRQRQLKKSKAALTELEQNEVDSRWDAYWSEMAVNLGYAPLTIHWSLKNGLFKNEVRLNLLSPTVPSSDLNTLSQLWVGVFGLLAGMASFRTGWKATALSLAPADGTGTVQPPSVEDDNVPQGL